MSVLPAQSNLLNAHEEERLLLKKVLFDIAAK